MTSEPAEGWATSQLILSENDITLPEYYPGEMSTLMLLSVVSGGLLVLTVGALWGVVNAAGALAVLGLISYLRPKSAPVRSTLKKGEVLKLTMLDAKEQLILAADGRAVFEVPASRDHWTPHRFRQLGEAVAAALGVEVVDQMDSGLTERINTSEEELAFSSEIALNTTRHFERLSVEPLEPDGVEITIHTTSFSIGTVRYTVSERGIAIGETLIRWERVGEFALLYDRPQLTDDLIARFVFLVDGHRLQIGQEQESRGVVFARNMAWIADTIAEARSNAVHLDPGTEADVPEELRVIARKEKGSPLT